MNNLSEHHENLMLGQITGSLSDEEADEFNELWTQDAGFQAAHQHMLERFPDEISANYFERLDKAGYWKDLSFLSPHKLTPVRRISFNWRIAGAAAAAIIVVLGTLLFRDAPEKMRMPVVAQKNEAVELRLANGKKINLSAQQGKVLAENATLHNKDKTLKYTVSGNEPSGINSVTVPVGMDYKIVLSDGSQVWMNSITRLEFPFRFSNDRREITIHGEAYLEIAKDSKRPFIVHLPNSSVQVLGTAFNVNSYDTSAVKVSLVNGKVNMNANHQSISLSPGNQAILKQTNIIKQPFNAKTELSWRNGLYYFEDVSLQQLEPVLNRWFGVRVQVDNIDLKSKSFAGVLDKNQPLAVFLDDLKGISKITSFIDKEGVLHFK